MKVHFGLCNGEMLSQRLLDFISDYLKLIALSLKSFSDTIFYCCLWKIIMKQDVFFYVDKKGFTRDTTNETISVLASKLQYFFKGIH